MGRRSADPAGVQAAWYSNHQCPLRYPDRRGPALELPGARCYATYPLPKRARAADSEFVIPDIVRAAVGALRRDLDARLAPSRELTAAAVWSVSRTTLVRRHENVSATAGCSWSASPAQSALRLLPFGQSDVPLSAGKQLIKGEDLGLVEVAAVQLERAEPTGVGTAVWSAELAEVAQDQERAGS